MKISEQDLKLLRELDERPRQVVDDDPVQDAYHATRMQTLMKHGLVERVSGRPVNVQRQQIGNYDTLMGNTVTEYRTTDVGREVLRKAPQPPSSEQP